MPMTDDTQNNEEKTDVTMTTDDSIEATANTEEVLREELVKAKNDYLYLRAEFDNYRRQSTKERSDLIRFAGERLAKDLLDTLDIFDSALIAEVSDTNYKNFVSGIQLTAQQLRNTLAKHQITELPCHGLPFDPNLHEALSSEATNEVAPGHISRVFKKAYKFHDKILRPAQVVVAKEKE
jgi:molecular chaperone GrpE